MNTTTAVQDDLTDDMDDLDDDFEDDETPETAPSEPVRTRPKAAKNTPKPNPVARWMASRGWRSDYPRWVWWAAGGTLTVFGLGVIGAVAPDQTPEPTVRTVTVTAPAAAPGTTIPQIDPFVGMPPRHPLVDWVLNGRVDQQTVIANQSRTSRDKSGALADPCRLWVGITLRQDGSKVMQLLLNDSWSPAFPVPLFIGAQCGRPEPHQFGEVTVPAPNPATTTTAAPPTTSPVELAPALTVENPVQQLRSAVGAGTSSTTTTAAPVPLVHYATQGQGMLAIARQYGVTVDELAAVNGWSTDAQLTLGQAVVIPGRFVQ
jgi:LysM repeat protein